MLASMARPLRTEYPGAYYHVMNLGLSHRNICPVDKGSGGVNCLALTIWISRFECQEIEEKAARRLFISHSSTNLEDAKQVEAALNGARLRCLAG